MGKQLIFLLLSAFASAMAMAETVVCTEGCLSKAVTDKSVLQLTVSGYMDVRDFNFISENLQLLNLDISQVAIKGYTCRYGEQFFGLRGSFDADAIPPYSFFGSKIETIKLPSSLKAIGEASFAGCHNLCNIEIPATVEYISNSAFHSSGISTVSISAKHIGDNAFAGCKNLSSVTLGNSVEHIGNSAFEACNALSSLMIADDSQLSSIGEKAFANTAIASFDFSKCMKVSHMGCWAFAGSPITNASLPDNLGEVADGIFFGNQSVSTINIPAAAYTIGDYAYYGNSSAKHITIPSKIASIGNNAFENTGLVEVVALPEGVPELGKDVFKNVNNDQHRANLYVNENYIEAYRSALQWNEFNIKIDDGSSVENICSNNRITAHFEGHSLIVNADDNISSIAVSTESGINIALKSPMSKSTAIDTQHFAGYIYIVSVTLVDGTVKKMKLLRK